jgi:hypothetical protein
MTSLFKAVLVSLTLTVGMAVVGLGSCYVSLLDLGEPSFDEVTRVPHPTSALDAVVVETNGGATTSFGYEIFVVVRGGHPDPTQSLVSLYDTSRSRCAYGVNVRWEGESNLVVEYLDSKSMAIRHTSWSLQGLGGAVSVQPGSNDPTAPCGGMLYNLENGLPRLPQPN